MPHTMAKLFVMFYLAIASCGFAEEIRLEPNGQAQALLDRAKPGDTFLMASGTWADTALKLHVQATEEAPVTLRAEKPHETVMTGRSSLRISGSWITVADVVLENPIDTDEVLVMRTSSSRFALDCRITNCIIRQTSTKPIAKESKWVSIYGKRNRVDHCSFSGKSSRGTTLVVWVGDEPGNHRIEKNYFGPRPELGRNGGETIRIGTSEVSMREEGTLVADNVFEACDGETEIVSNKSCGNRYEGNLFKRCAGSLTLRHGNRCVVTRNVFLGENKSRTGGIRVIGEDHVVTNNYLEGLSGDDARSAISFMNGIPNSPLHEYFQVKRATVAFNMVVRCKHPITIGVGASKEQSLPPIDCTFANNAFVIDKRLMTEHAKPIDWKFMGNHCEAPNSVDLPEGFVRSRLSLVLGENGLQRPQSDSELFRAAIGDWPDITVDLEGRLRESPHDVGCYAR